MTVNDIHWHPNPSFTWTLPTQMLFSKCFPLGFRDKTESWFSFPIDTGPKLILLAVQQTNKSQDKLLGQRIVTLFRKPENWEEGVLVSKTTILPKLEFRLLLRKKGRICGWRLQISWCQNPLILHLSKYTRSWCSCKPPTGQMLFFCSAAFYLYMVGKVLHL